VPLISLDPKPVVIGVQHIDQVPDETVAKALWPWLGRSGRCGFSIRKTVRAADHGGVDLVTSARFLAPFDPAGAANVIIPLYAWIE
jgi:hypothetical protein